MLAFSSYGKGFMHNEISFGSATSNAITGHTTPAEIIADIQTGRWAKEIAAVRAATGDEAARLKRKLPAVLWSGKFNGRSNKGLIQHSGLICADIDKCADRVGELHDIARNDPHVVAAFVSPSGTGIKIVFRADDFNAVRAHVASHYRAQVDEAAKDIARLCFVSHDPAAFYNADAVPLAVPDEPEPSKEYSQPESVAPSTRAQIAERILGPIHWTDDGGFCKCPGQHLHTTGNGERDCKVMLSGAPTISCFHSSCSDIRAGVNHQIRSLIGKAESPAKRNDIAAEYLGEQAEAEPLDMGARLAQVRFNILTPPPLETAVYTLSNGTPTHTRGNISATNAQVKAGKTAFVSALISAAITAMPDDCDSLGFRAVNPDRLPVALLDTEHSKEHNWKLGDRIFRRALLADSDQLHLFRLAGFSLRELNAALEHLLKERKWHSVFLDGIGDFVSDVNDPEECNAFVARLHGAAIEHDTHILNVLHLNPTSETKSRGHLGSQLERKAETNLRIEKKDGVSIVYSDRNRGADIPKDIAPRFVWSAEHQMHVSADSIGNLKKAAALDELREQCREAFSLAGKNALTWTDFVASAKRVPGVKSQRTAERIHTDAKRENFIVKNIVGQWELA
jgi:hypothetical protein